MAMGLISFDDRQECKRVPFRVNWGDLVPAVQRCHHMTDRTRDHPTALIFSNTASSPNSPYVMLLFPPTRPNLATQAETKERAPRQVKVTQDRSS